MPLRGTDTHITSLLPLPPDGPPKKQRTASYFCPRGVAFCHVICLSCTENIGSRQKRGGPRFVMTIQYDLQLHKSATPKEKDTSWPLATPNARRHVRKMRVWTVVHTQAVCTFVTKQAKKLSCIEKDAKQVEFCQFLTKSVHTHLATTRGQLAKCQMHANCLFVPLGHDGPLLGQLASCLRTKRVTDLFWPLFAANCRCF